MIATVFLHSSMDNAGCVHCCPSVLMICDEPCPGWQITASIGVHSSIEVAGFVLFVKGLFAGHDMHFAFIPPALYFPRGHSWHWGRLQIQGVDGLHETCDILLKFM